MKRSRAGKASHGTLREPDRTTYDKMIEAARQYADSVEYSGRTFPTEAFFMAILFAQNKMMEQLQNELQKSKRQVV